MLFSKEDQEEIMDNLEKDSNLLKSMNIMDYSLLLAVERNLLTSRGNKNNDSFNLSRRFTQLYSSRELRSMEGHLSGNSTFSMNQRSN